MSIQRIGIVRLALALLVCILFAVSAFADSQVRIVRLSDLEAEVQIDHGTGYEKAIRNMPITQGVRLWAKEGGLAEVELENGTTVRLAPNTIMEFPELSLRDSGAKVSAIVLKQGTAYFNINKSKHDEFQVAFGHEQATLKNNARFRVQLGDAKAEVSVTKGDVHFVGPSGDVKIGKNNTASFDLANQDRYTLAKGVSPEQYDDWNKQENQYQNDYAYRNSATGSWPYSYGLSDLNYYGNYAYLPGYGLMWQPFSAGAGFDPFVNGAWSWYPGLGYTFVSGYPWGWMPYRYGSWAYVPGFGWGWIPGAFNRFNTVPVVINPPAGFRPPQPPAIAGINRRPTIPVRQVPDAAGVSLRGREVGPGLGAAARGRTLTGPAMVHGAPIISGRHGQATVARPGVFASPGMGRGSFAGRVNSGGRATSVGHSMGGAGRSGPMGASGQGRVSAPPPSHR
ncbi:MAG TPA: FecR family protein [Terriglobales bacterium]|nr:FecR family protein [Terriglobales bacterium]